MQDIRTNDPVKALQGSLIFLLSHINRLCRAKQFASDKRYESLKSKTSLFERLLSQAISKETYLEIGKKINSIVETYDIRDKIKNRDQAALLVLNPFLNDRHTKMFGSLTITPEDFEALKYMLNNPALKEEHKEPIWQYLNVIVDSSSDI